MDRDWQPARVVRIHHSNSSNAIIQYAANGLVETRAKAVTGIAWPAGADGHFSIPKEFWAAISRLPGSEYRDWQSGIFKFRKAGGARQYRGPIDVIGVEFDMLTIRSALGISEVEKVADTIDQHQPMPLSADAGRSKGGAPRESEKWDAVTLALVRLANEGKLDRTLDTRFKRAAEIRRAVLDDPDVAALDTKEETIKPLIAKIFRDMLD